MNRNGEYEPERMPPTPEQEAARIKAERCTWAGQRMKRLEEYRTRLPYSKWLSDLKEEGRTIVRHFIQRHDHLTRSEFEERVQRMYLFVEPKPRNWTLINQVLICVNSTVKEK